MRNWSRELWKYCETSAAQLYASLPCMHPDEWTLPPKSSFECRKFWMHARSSSRTWWQSLSSPSMGTVNQYKLITWLDPLGSKTSSINHASTFQAAVPLQLWATPSKNEEGREKIFARACVCVCLCGWWCWFQIITGHSLSLAGHYIYTVHNSIL